MNNWNDVNEIFEETYDQSNYLDGRKRNSVSRKRKWREIEVKKEKLRLQRELLEMTDYS